MLDPFGPEHNHAQVLYGLRYSTTAWRLKEESPFHEELGYWLWDPAEKQVMRCFMVPRGVTVIAGTRSQGVPLGCRGGLRNLRHLFQPIPGPGIQNGSL